MKTWTVHMKMPGMELLTVKGISLDGIVFHLNGTLWFTHPEDGLSFRIAQGLWYAYQVIDLP